eukprot:244419-Pyramimonas_sp.AAC.1
MRIAEVEAAEPQVRRFGAGLVRRGWAGLRGGPAPPPPRLDDMYEAILGWDLREVAEGKAELGLAPSAYAEVKGAMPTRFDSAEQYSAAFRPLLLREMQAAVQQRAEEGVLGIPVELAPVQLQHVGRLVLTQFKVGDTVEAFPPDGALMEGDLVVLARAKLTPEQGGGGGHRAGMAADK